MRHVLKKAYVVTDLGPGDGGKGGVVHRIATMLPVHTVIKRGGGQGSHGVFSSNGLHFAFSHWGCGTLEGIKTHVSSQLVASPIGILNEADMLRFQCGIDDPFEMLTLDEDCLCATSYHGISSRLKELARGAHPRGTIGTGVGEAYRAWERHPELAIFARDLSKAGLREKVAACRDQVRRELEAILLADFLPEDREIVDEQRSWLFDDGFFEYVVQKLELAGRLTHIVDRQYLGREILSRDGAVVVESSHGILTDKYRGFHPHTSAIRTIPSLKTSLFEDAGYDGKIVNIGVTRAYGIRHGAGPMPTADEAMSEHLLPGSQKDNNRWQGKIRVGPMDLVLLRYAINQCGGPSAFDGLAISWFDQIQKNGEWKLCNRYRRPLNGTYFTETSDIRVRMTDDEEQLRYQEGLCTQLFNCVPEIESIPLPSDSSRDQLYQLCAETLRERLHVPVRMISFGPTELDKVCK